MISLPCGTQWSQKPMETFPAARPVRMCTSGSAAEADASFRARRRVTLALVITYPPALSGTASGACTCADATLEIPRRRRLGQSLAWKQCPDTVVDANV